MRCSRCGAESPADFTWCAECGDPLGSPAGDRAVASDRAADSIPDASAESAGSSGAGRAGLISGRLRVEQGAVDRGEYELDEPVVVIGRRLGNEIVVRGANASRRHARIVRQDGGFAIEDTNSAQGTLVNDEPIDAPRSLRHGDVVRIGDAVFVFETDSPEGAVTDAVGAEAASLKPDRPPPPELQVESPPPPFAVSTGAAVGENPIRDGRSSPVAPPTAVSKLESVRGDIVALNRDLAASMAGLGGLAGRVERLERSLDQVSGDLRPRLQAVRPLRGLADALADLEVAGGSERLEAARALLDQLADRPRDADLLAALSQQAAVLHELVHLHRRLAPAVPEIREALRRIVA